MGNLQKRRRPGIRHFHVVRHDDRWWVEDEDGASLHASLEQQEAVTWAIRAAQLDHARGMEVLVCVEQSDGTWKAAWHA